MSLIKCPECGKEISDKAISCPMCGYPIKEISNELQPSPSTTGMNVCPKCGKFIIAKQNCPDCGTDMIDCNCTEAKWTGMLMDGTLDKWEEQIRNKYVLSSDKFDNDLYRNRIKDEKKEDAYYNELVNNTPPTIHCPTCSSTNVKKVSGTSKAISVAMFGLFSQKVKKQFHCNSCGYEW